MVGLILKPFLWLFKFILNAVIISIILLIVLLLVGNFWLPKATGFLLGKMSGFPSEIEKSNGALLRGCIDFENCKIKNPEIFKNENFLTIKRLAVDIKLRGLFKKEIIIQKFVLNIDDITTVKNSGGVSNYSTFVNNLKATSNELGSKFGKSDEKKVVPKPADTAQRKQPSIQKLAVAIGTVHVVDESTGMSREYEINYSREFVDVNDFKKLTAQLAFDLGKWELSFLADSIVSSVVTLPTSAIDGVLKAKDVAVDVVDKTTNAIGTGLKKLLPGSN
ncbi:MAG: hypothetical protein LBR91_01940 [Puniceicoccales bacterium]|jgi:hypothetical protein|nr:hypothetical protein [Puniceicoccales bacterium]